MKKKSTPYIIKYKMNLKELVKNMIINDDIKNRNINSIF